MTGFNPTKKKFLYPSEIEHRPVIISRITSGLGNQLFQYVFARWISERFRADLFIDTSWFDHFQIHSPRRKERLRIMGLTNVEEFSDGIHRWLLGISTIGKTSLKYKAQRVISPLIGVDYFNEKSEHRCPEVIDTLKFTKPMVLNGYWQFWQPAHAMGKALGKEIRNYWPWSEGALKIKNAIELASFAAFLHVRRGDYLKFGMHTLDVHYYKTAASLIESRIGIRPYWFIFSEDKTWCSDHLGFLKNSTIVEYHSENSDIEDILLMSQCLGGVTANSSFSWWGAALSDQEHRIIVSPKRWNGTPESDNWEMSFPEWITI